MLHLAICDDDSEMRDVLDRMLSEAVSNRKIVIDEFEDGESFLKEIEEGTFYDIILMDIELPGMDGIETGVRLRQEHGCMDSLVIFVTAYPDYVLRCFDAFPFDFLRKPVCEEKLKAVLERAARKITAENRIFEQPRRKEGDIRCPVREILWFEIGPAHRIQVVMRKRRECFRGRLDEVEEQLEKREFHNFLRVQKSYLVNMDHIVRYNLQMVWVEGLDAGIGVGEKYKRKVADRLTAYFRRE